MIPGHVLHETIKEVTGIRRILRSRFHGADAVTRILLEHRVTPSRDSLVKGIVLHGSGSTAGFHGDLAPTLEGYRAAARLSHPDPRWPTALAAGVLPDGFVYVTTRWIPGTPLHRLPDDLDDAARRDIAVQAAELLSALHGRKIAFGDLKAANLVYGLEQRVSLIDLDTLREVPDAQTAAFTTDATPDWAAPEQVERQETFLASDVWAWANLLGTLFPRGVPPDWRPAVSACRARAPLARPRADALAAHLRDGSVPLYDAWNRRIDLDTVEACAAPTGSPSGSTERVPESDTETERVEQDEASIDPPPEARWPAPAAGAAERLARMRERHGGWPIVAALVAVVALCGIPVALWDQKRVAEANRLADEALEAMEQHKTKAEQNGQDRRAELRQKAEAAYEVRSTPGSAAVRALATVWEPGWQDKGKVFDDAQWETGRAAVEDAEGSERPEALLAEGILHAASCRLNASAPSVEEACARARSALRSFREMDAPAWMRVEGAWTEVLLLTDLAARQAAVRDPAASQTYAEALTVCDASTEWRAHGPVNGPELLQDCLVAANGTQDVDRYLSYAAELLASDGAKLRQSSVEHVYRVWDGCSNTSVSRRKKGDWKISGDDWCLALGDAARDCDALASRHVADGLASAPDRPWSQLTRHLDPMNSRCLR